MSICTTSALPLRRQSARLLPPELTGRIVFTDPASIAAIAATWPRFCAALDAMAELWDDGIPIEDFAIVWQELTRLIALGVRFAGDFLARCRSLHIQIRGTEDDSDFDDADEAIDREDLDDDSSVEDNGCRDIAHADNVIRGISSDAALEGLLETHCYRDAWASGDPTAAARAVSIGNIVAAGCGLADHRRRNAELSIALAQTASLSDGADESDDGRYDDPDAGWADQWEDVEPDDGQ